VLHLATFDDLYRQRHSLGLYCMTCNRWDVADLECLIANGRGDWSLVDTRFRCRDCGGEADKQIRPPVPVISNAVGYIGT
jgi:hypothetical protein